MNRKLLNTADIVILLLAVLLTIWLYHFFWFNHTQSGKADFLMIQIADKPPQQYSLNRDRRIKIKGTMGESIIEIKQRKVRFIHSPCRNQFCVLHGWISHNSDITACLPNQMSISLHSTQDASQEQNNHFDALSGGQ